MFNNLQQEHIETLDRTQADQDKEIQSLGEEVQRCMKELFLKLDKNDAAKIWSYFDRFALYVDLKDLYGKTIPELAKFE